MKPIITKDESSERIAKYNRLLEIESAIINK